MNIKERIKKVLDSGYLMSLGTVDDGGVWVADLIYVHDEDLNIYWMSDPDTRHSKAILNEGKVSGTITVSGSREKGLGIQFDGLASKIDGSRFDLTQKHFSKRGKPVPKEDDDVLQGDLWYVLKPTKVELIDEENFGFEKQELK